MTFGFSKKDWVLLILLIVIWGGNAAAVKIGTNEISPYLLIPLRGMGVSLMALPFIKKITWDDFKNLALVSLVFYTIHYSVMYQALNAINSSSFAVLIMLGMPFSIILSAIFLKEKVGKWTWVGLIIAFSGLITAFGIPDIEHYPFGAFLTTSTAFFWACGSLLMKRTKHIPLMTFTFYTFAIATPLLLLIGLAAGGTEIFNIEEANLTMLGLSLGYQIVLASTMAAVWAYLIAHHPAEHVSPFLLLQVPVAAIAGHFVLGETLSREFFMSAFLITAGVGLIHYRRLKNTKKQS